MIPPRIRSILPLLLAAVLLSAMFFSSFIHQVDLGDVQDVEKDGPSEKNPKNETRAEDFQYLGTLNLGGTTQYGSVYNRYYSEYWVKQSWSSTTITRYNDAGNYVGTRNVVGSSIALGTDSDGNLYVGDNSKTFYKFDRNGNQVWARTYNDGSQARGITCDDHHVYALFNYGPILKLDKNTGAKIGTITPSRQFSNAFSMVYYDHKLIVSDNHGSPTIHVYDMNGQYLRGISPPVGTSNAYGIVWTGREFQACPYQSNTWYRYSAVDLLVYTESAALVVPKGEESICYARKGPYTFSVNLTTNENLNDASELKVYLDYNTTNATLGYNWTRNEFFKQQDARGDVQLLRDNCTVADDGLKRVWVNFSVVFNFTFPHERPVDCFTNTSSVADEHTIDRFPYLFRVENDLEFLGTPKLMGEQQGRIEEGDWVKGGQNITIDNMTVVYSGSPSLYPDDDLFDVKIADTSGNVWWDNGSSGKEVELNIRAGNLSDEEENYCITIVGIPDSGICMTNFTFPVRIDAEPPAPPLNLLCHADSFNGRETGYTDELETFVTWDEVQDHQSGLSGYYYSRTDNSGTQNGTFTVDREVRIGDLEEGPVRVYVWCVDLVGNIGEAASSGILVDLTPPVFSNYAPADGVWHNKSQVLCSVEVADPDGSGVDGSTIEYSVSTGGHMNYESWMPAGLFDTGSPLFPSVDHYFSEGVENYIKWRARDLSGNGYVESLPTNIRVDTTSVSFEDVISPNDLWYDHRDITTMIRVSDTGSGVDPSSIQVRTSVSGPGAFGPWKAVPPENVTEVESGTFEITVTHRYAEGKDNYVMWRGTDLVGNPHGVSKAFNLKIDTTPVYFWGFFPDNESYSNGKTVECSVSIMDDGTGVDASSVEYSVTTKGPGDDGYGKWKTVPNVFPGNPVQVTVEVEFEWGRDNFIRFRADDIIGTGYNISEEFIVWVNSEPVPEISSPLTGEEYPEDSSIDFNASLSWDADGDELAFYWSSNVTDNRSLGYGPHFSARLVPGKHAVTLHVSDGHGYNVTKKVLLTITEREKSPEKNGGGSIIPGKGSSSFWYILLIVAAIVVLLIVLMLVMIVRRRKKDSGEVGPAPLDHHPAIGPAVHPYPEGQYAPQSQQGYYGTASRGPVPGAHPGQPLPSPGTWAPSSGTPASGMPFPQQVPALPQLVNTGTAYSLPAFSTDEGLQDLARLALPPASDGTENVIFPVMPESAFQGGLPAPQQSPEGAGTFTPAMPEVAPAGSSVFPQQPVDTVGGISPTLQDVPLTGSSAVPQQPVDTVGGIPPTLQDVPLADSSAVPQRSEHNVDPAPAALPADVPPVPAAVPPQADNTAGILPRTDLEIAFSFESAVPPIPGTPAAEIAPFGGLPPVPEGPPPDATPLPGPSLPAESSMQCHSCSHIYSVTIAELPAIVTCPVCQTQGMVGSL